MDDVRLGSGSLMVSRLCLGCMIARAGPSIARSPCRARFASRFGKSDRGPCLQIAAMPMTIVNLGRQETR